MTVIDQFFAGTIIDEDTEKSLEYCQLIKIEMFKQIWSRLLDIDRTSRALKQFTSFTNIRFQKHTSQLIDKSA